MFSVYAWGPPFKGVSKDRYRLTRISLIYCNRPYDCLKGSEALVIFTEWNEFRNPDFQKIGKLMSKKVIFDGRNIYDPLRVKESGFEFR